MAISLLVGACGGSEATDPATVLAEYENARNSGDVDGLISLYADDAIVTRHPLDDDGTAHGVEEIRLLESRGASIQTAATR